jgi:hypothetical protein
MVELYLRITINLQNQYPWALHEMVKGCSGVRVRSKVQNLCGRKDNILEKEKNNIGYQWN